MISLLMIFVCVLSVSYCHQLKRGGEKAMSSIKDISDVSAAYAVFP
ncbi:hypothetical protein QYS49_33240 [Marivirga salinae]|uniref:Uncharacterized protein n=1 Tax=Marivirga salinarum TaxID=3059078 RepID=A0AA51NE47_9BACT|nr:hypothetical protein [Marivirga sp. BDSF4-3]WMN12326.1 hypothetical protein QYS49_33240 [Marivirga sp. BDSF4-3]